MRFCQARITPVNPTFTAQVRAAVLIWDECDAFNVLDKWEATYAVSADAIANKPENWVPLWGWKKRLPSAAEGG